MVTRPYLLQDIPDYAKITQPTTGGYSKILDFAGPTPPDGYGMFRHLSEPNNLQLLANEHDHEGPFNSARIKNLPVNAVTGKSQAVRNADSYVWYAMNKYWSYGSSSKAWLSGQQCTLTSVPAGNVIDISVLRRL